MARPKSMPREFKHGTRACYVGMKCRCDECREANRLYYHERQRAMKEAAQEEKVKEVSGSPQVWTNPSGEKVTRVYRRACPGVNGKPCEWGSHLRKDSTGGICKRCREKLSWNGMVLAERARWHILALSRQGVGYKSVAESACVATSVVMKIRSGERKQIRAQTEKRILEVDATAKADSAYVSAAPTNRIIKKLLKRGYSKAEIARRLGYKSPALQLKTKLILVKSAHKVQKLWEEIEEEERIAAEMRRFCTKCGFSHAKKARQGRLRSALPATTEVLREVFYCYYGGEDDGAEYRMLLRDLNEIGALKEGPVGAKSPWYLPR